jgi:hypothetical protein
MSRLRCLSPEVAQRVISRQCRGRGRGTATIFPGSHLRPPPLIGLAFPGSPAERAAIGYACGGVHTMIGCALFSGLFRAYLLIVVSQLTGSV